MLGRLKDASKALQAQLGLDDEPSSSTHAGTGREGWRLVGARRAVAEAAGLGGADADQSLEGLVRHAEAGHAALSALEAFADARRQHGARGDWATAAAPLETATNADPRRGGRRWPLTPAEVAALEAAPGESAGDGLARGLEALRALAQAAGARDDDMSRAYESLRRALLSRRG